MLQSEANTIDVTTALLRRRCLLKRQRRTCVDDGLISYASCSDGVHHVMGSPAEALAGLLKPPSVRNGVYSWKNNDQAQ